MRLTNFTKILGPFEILLPFHMLLIVQKPMESLNL